MSALNHLPRTTIKQWEEAGASLVTSPKNYMDLCLTLTPDLVGQGAEVSYLATRIDSTLQVISDQVLRFNSTLVRTRNRLVSSLNRLPEEVLSKIFMHVIFVYDHSKVSPWIEQEVPVIYRRLYGLLGVCSTWKDIIMARGLFWSVIPIIKMAKGKQSPSELIVQRAGGSKLHLVADIDSTDTANDLVHTLSKYSPCFYKVDIVTHNHRLVAEVVDKLLQGPIGTLVELSIEHPQPYNSSWWIPSDDDYVVRPNHPHQLKLATLIGRLTAFHIRGAYFHSQSLAFSSRLVDLHIDSVTLGYDREIYPFLQALSSASGVRNLKIVSVDTFYEPVAKLEMQASSPIALPNLQSLFVKNLYFNTLKLLLPMFAPGSHHLTLFLGIRSLYHNLYDRRLPDDPDYASPDIISLYEALEMAPVDTLMLSNQDGGSNWLTGTMLHGLLAATPTLKTLKIHSWDFRDDTWGELRGRPLNDDTNQLQRLFPALENLQLSRANIFVDEGLQEMMTSHPLKTVVLGGNHIVTTGPNTEWKPIDESNHMVNWLRANVPRVTLVGSGHHPPEFRSDRWPIW